MSESAKDLKAKKKAEKAARRAASKPPSEAPAGANPNHHANSAHEQTSSGSQVSHGSQASQGVAQSFASGFGLGPFQFEAPKEVAAFEDTHPAILQLALQMRNLKCIGSTARCKAMMEAFVLVIEDFQPPQDATFSRALTAHLSRQIEVLKTGRALSVAMGNAIRWLKQQTSALRDLGGNAAKDQLVQAITAFLKERLEVASRVIVESAKENIKDGATILTFGHSLVVEQTFAAAYADGKRFEVICVDSEPLREGKTLATRLVDLGISTTYCLVSALPYVLDEQVSYVMVGAHAMLSNGHLYSRIGTSLVAMAASDFNVNVLVLCETVKFSDRIQLDSFAVNEAMPERTNQIFYDLTDQRYISKVITELGSLPASSVPVILREYKQLQ